MASTLRSSPPQSVSDSGTLAAEAAGPAVSQVGHRRVALVGAGRIAETHAQVLKERGDLELAAVIDPAIRQAETLAQKWGFRGAYGSLEEALQASGLDAVHVLVPPPLHRPVAEQCLAAGLDVLLEKPMAETDEDCAALQEAARTSGAALHINQNFVFHPAQSKLKRLTEDGSLGRLRHVSCHFAMPLAQLQARQFSHWMFREPRNLLLEQAVHPLSQIDDLVGAVKHVSVSLPPPRIIDGFTLQTRWLITMICERGTAELFVSIGESFPVWSITALFSDGTATADFVNNRLVTDRAGKWMDFWDSHSRGASAARQLRRQSRRNALDYILSTAKLRPRSDVFYQSMRGSIDAFYKALDCGETLDGSQGRRLAALCGAIAEQAGLGNPAPRPQPDAPTGNYDVLVIGGTGLIGRPLVETLLASGRRVAVLARNTANLPPLFHDERVGVIRGDVTEQADLERAMRGVKAVVNLAHAGGADSWPEVERRIVGGATMVAEACLRTGVERLIHASTIAALYLGDPKAVVTGDTPCDPHPDRRGSYSRAKAYAERELLRMHRERGLPLTIVRPGVVIGNGGMPFHSGIGFYNREQHCMGWNAGDNPLPLVLAEDTASAIALALDNPVAIGRTYNIVGDVRLTAKEYTAELARALGRPLRYHPQSLFWQQGVEIVKWLVKRAIGRSDPVPSVADLKSRGLAASFDTSDIKRDLGWKPVSDRAEFVRKAIEVHAAP